ncbi:MAG: M18 family aminopeptidase [Propionibacteriaceae bacterium]|jgi:aspartyl aminopeptidase|nr:M18 family aminopeptidase [Propionibacteriaceae bacterium]
MTFADFLAASPSSYHAVGEVAEYLGERGYILQHELDAWNTNPGGHMVVRDGAIIAYCLPQNITNGVGSFRIVGAHTDSPGFKLKPHPAHTAHGFEQAGMEVYGGPLLNSWLDREFGLAGRVVTTWFESRKVVTGPWFRIPQLAPHLDRSVNDSLHLDQQTHLLPIWAMAGAEPDSASGLMKALAHLADCEVDEIAGHDLFSYIPQPPEVFGLNSEFLAGGRMDNLTSVYAGMVALGEATGKGYSGHSVPVLACFDHEEVGSSTRTGAAGPFLETVLDRIVAGLGMTTEETHRTYAQSWVVSADAGHSVHPNYPTMHDPDERPILGGGPMLKVNAKQHYASDGLGAALWRCACEEAGVPYQTFVSNNAVSCGTTIGPITATRLGITTVDVGVPLLSMHSAREMCCPADVDGLSKALAGFYTM